MEVGGKEEVERVAGRATFNQGQAAHAIRGSDLLLNDGEVRWPLSRFAREIVPPNYELCSEEIEQAAPFSGAGPVGESSREKKGQLARSRCNKMGLLNTRIYC